MIFEQLKFYQAFTISGTITGHLLIKNIKSPTNIAVSILFACYYNAFQTTLVFTSEINYS